MIKKLSCFALSLLLVFVCAMQAFACDLYLSCEEIEGIVVSKGTNHLAGGKEKKVFVACVDLDVTKTSLKEFVANCHDDSITVRTGNAVIVIAREEFPSGGEWFCVEHSTPEEALDTAMKMCPDKVKSYLP